MGLELSPFSPLLRSRPVRIGRASDRPIDIDVCNEVLPGTGGVWFFERDHRVVAEQRISARWESDFKLLTLQVVSLQTRGILAVDSFWQQCSCLGLIFLT